MYRISFVGRPSVYLFQIVVYMAFSRGMRLSETGIY